MSKEQKTKKQPTEVTEAELWQLRALDAQQGRLQAEIQLLQQQGTEVQTQMQEFVTGLREKYGDAQVSPDGKLIYDRPAGPIPGIPGVPHIPVAPAPAPVPEPEEEEENEEE